MTHLLDTNVAIRLRDGEPEALDRVARLTDVMLSVVTVVELEGGVYRDPAQTHLRRPRLDAMLAALTVVPFDAAAAAAYGGILALRGYSRRLVIDRMIAATALVLRATVVTANPEDFADLTELRLLRW